MSKQYRILKTFKGSQNGLDSHEFVAGEIRPISDHLASAVAGAGYIEEVTEAKAPAERETKVVTPAETKVVVPAEVKASQAEIDAMDFKALKVEAKLRGIKIFGLSEAKLRIALAE